MATPKSYDVRGFSPYQDQHRAQYTRPVRSLDGKPMGFPYQDWDAEVIINSMVNLDRNREYSIYNLVHNIKKDHNVKNLTDLFDLFYVMATDKIQNACINWANPGTASSNYYLTCSVANGWGFTPYMGLSCGTGYIETQLFPKNGVQYQQYNASCGVYLSYYNDVAQSAQGGGSFLLTENGPINEIFSLNTNISLIGWNVNGVGSPASNYCWNVPKGCMSVGINQPNTVGLTTSSGGDVNSYFYLNGYTMGTLYEIPISITASPNNFVFSMGSANNSVPGYGAYWVGNGQVDPGIMSRRLNEYMESLGLY